MSVLRRGEFGSAEFDLKRNANAIRYVNGSEIWYNKAYTFMKLKDE